MEKQSETIFDAFNDYVTGFDIAELPIKRKWKHSFDVASISHNIVKQLDMDAENIALAQVIAILHDFARFEQWTQFKTFTDAKSFDHGDYACELLFEKGHIKRFEIDEKYYPVIDFCIRNHNKYEIDLSAVPLAANIDALLHAQIIRDADKIGIVESRLACPDEVPFVSKDAGGINPEALAQVRSGRTIKSTLLHSYADSLLGCIVYPFDLYTIPAKKIFREQKYTERIFDKFKDGLDPESAGIIAGIVKQIVKDLNDPLS